MATVMAKPTGTATKMKKPPAPMVQTNIHGSKPTGPSASPLSARKSLPGQGQTPASATSNAATTNGAARPNRRLQRLTTRNNSTAEGPLEKRAAKKYPEPYGMPPPFQPISGDGLTNPLCSAKRYSHPPQIQRMHPFSHCTSSSYTLSFRPTGWQFQLSLRNACLRRTPGKGHYSA